MNKYDGQVRLLLRILPLVSNEKNFALKGGTAINLFIRDMPRLSVDIDLTYIPVEDREKSITGISQGLADLSVRIKNFYPAFQVIEKRINDKFLKKEYISKLIVSHTGSIVKIEPNFTIRGAAYPIEVKTVVKAVQDRFKLSASMNILSINDLYGGKICAALDRQHPRDLFDAKLLLENEGITPDIHKGFLTYLLSHNRPINEMLNPNRQDISKVFQTEFDGMTEIPVTLEELTVARETLVKEINSKFTSNEKDFLISFKSGTPDWSLLETLSISELPAIKWKLKNIQNMLPEKRKEQLEKLKAVLGIT